MPTPIAPPSPNPPPAAANVVKRWWTTCAHYAIQPNGQPGCELHLQLLLFGDPPCGRCRRYARKEL